jgi:adenine-specific DNA-methyltransferase
MSLNISYMGTKRQLAAEVADAVALSPAGPMLDLFSGMCAVGSAVASTRQVWCNDAQIFASTVAQCFFTAQSDITPPGRAVSLIRRHFEANRNELRRRFGPYLASEAAAFEELDPEQIESLDARLPNCATSRHFAHERRLLSLKPQIFPYRLFAITFPGGYFSLAQCIEIDSLRYAFDICLAKSKITIDQHQWFMIALCQAVSRTANTTGHFAQYLKVKPANVARIVRQRRRSVLQEWIRSLEPLSPIGTKRWRRGNLVTCGEALALIHTAAGRKRKPAVIYADPPYTNDQYSRYYHLYETLLRYDYPPSVGIGRYRPDRFHSAFSVKTQVANQMRLLVEGVAALGSDLVLSYPQNGLLDNTKSVVSKLLKENFRKHEVLELGHFHSSLGASKGVEKQPVTELLFRGYN